MDSITNPKVITTEGEVRACSFTRITLGVEGRVGALGWIRMSDKWFNCSHGPTQTKQQVG
jgi:hypothetical protein